MEGGEEGGELQQKKVWPMQTEIQRKARVGSMQVNLQNSADLLLLLLLLLLSGKKDMAERGVGSSLTCSAETWEEVEEEQEE